mmetsp:Transcript_2608/g.8817  ORF Transcript_2608/g.8817 Transcript_2608/m.8817 type:complete len:261 (-) Transcript_2608:466-1248(-)
MRGRRQLLRRQGAKVVPLVERPLADLHHALRPALQRVLDPVRVVEDVGESRELGRDAAGARAVLDLEVSHEPVLDAERGGGDRVAPHLLHPALHHPLRVSVRAQPERKVEPARRDGAELVEVDEQRRGADRVEGGGRALRPVVLDHPVLARMRVHVAEGEGGGRGSGGEVGYGLHQHVVRLEDEDEVGGDLPQQGGGGEQLPDRLGSVEHPEVEVRLDDRRGELGHEHGRDLTLEPVRLAALRRDQPREAGQLGAAARRV